VVAVRHAVRAEEVVLEEERGLVSWPLGGQRRRELAGDSSAIEGLLRTGTARTRETAAGVLRDVREVFALDLSTIPVGGD